LCDNKLGMKIAVIIPNLNGADIIGDAIYSITNQSTKADIVVVDNASIDNSIEKISAIHADTHIIRNRKNLGFAGGVNVGIRYALKHNYDLIALFNNDAVADKDWLKHLSNRLLNDRKVGIVASKQLHPDGTIDTTGDCYSVWGTPFPRGEGETDNNQYDTEQLQNITSATAGATLYRADLFHEIGLFDERFFAYYEDVDISLRARLVGWGIAYEPKALVQHAVSATSSKLGNFRNYHMLKNTFYLYIKLMPLSLLVKYLPRFIFTLTYKTIGELLKLRIWMILKVWAICLYSLPALVLERHRIQSKRKLKAEDFDKLLYKKLTTKQRQKLPLNLIR